MFKNIQKNLLLRHPLLWNTRIIPIIAIALVLHLIFFIIGYIRGTVDFTPNPEEYVVDVLNGIIVFFSISISILIFIFWLVYYTRNNAFKSFYPKSGTSLFKEWLIVFLVCVLNSAYFGSYFLGEDMRARSYFSEDEFSRRIDIISKASLFADGGFLENGDYYVGVNGQQELRHRDYFEYQGKRYPLNSLINKDISDFTYQSRNKDSLNNVRVKNWLVENRKDSVLWVMREFDKIAKEHGAKGNLTPEKWREITYNSPGFTEYITVGRILRYERDDHSSRFGHNTVYTEDVHVVEQVPGNGFDITKIDTISNVIKVIGNHTYIFPKYYVPLKQMEDSYSDISKAYSNPTVNEDFLLGVLYFSMCFSLIIFSFRVTSGRDWIIALLAFGVTALITGIFQITLLSSFHRMNYRVGEVMYWVFWLIIVAVLAILFLRPKASKGRTAIYLNIILWLCPWVLITLTVIAKSFMYIDDAQYGMSWQQSPAGQWIDSNFEWIMFGNALFIIVFMYFFTKAIRNWKGIAEA